MGFFLVEDLNDVPVRLGIQQLENIRSGRQHLRVDAGDLHRRTECDCGFSVIRLCGCRAGEHHANRHSKRSDS